MRSRIFKGVRSAAGASLLAGSMGVAGAVGVGLATSSVSSASGPPVAITTPNLPSGVVGHSYSAALGATGGQTPYTWTATTLPAGLHILSTGTITGTPTTRGTKTVHLTVTSNGSDSVAYNSIPSGGVTFAQDYEAHGTAQLGNQITLKTTTAKALGTVTVAMANFSTQAYTETITFNIYGVGATNAVGSLITSKTQKFAIPAGTPNPSVFTITFNMVTKNITLPSSVIYGIAFSTGPGPNGSNGSGHPQGGLAVGLSYTTTNVTVGSDPLHGTGSDYIDVTDANGGTNAGGGYTGNFCGGEGSHDVTQFVYDPGVGGTQPCVGTEALNHHTATPTPYLPVPLTFVPAVKIVTAPSYAEKTLPLAVSLPAPTVTSVAPGAGRATTTTRVTISGTDFTTVTSVTFGGTPAIVTRVTGPTKLTATAPSKAAGTDSVVVTAAGGPSTVDGSFTYLSGPTLTKVTPSAGRLAGGTTVTLTGTGFFTGVTSVTFGSGNHGATVHVSGPTSLTVKAPAHVAGTVTVSVTTPAGSSGTVPYTYDTVPTITSLSRTGPLSGGNKVTITGTGFTGSSAVKFGTTTATSFTVRSSTQLLATAPAHAAGTVQVSVTTPGGTTAATPADLYKYAYPVPAVSGTTPATGVAAGGTVVTLTGSGFTGVTAVYFGTTEVTVTISVNAKATQLTVKSPAGTAGASVNVEVVTPGGRSTAVPADLFTYVAGPTITSLSRTSGSVSGGTKVTITGTGFSTVHNVKFGTTTARTFTVRSSTQIVATSPAHAAGQVRISVTTGAGTTPATSADLFAFH